MFIDSYQTTILWLNAQLLFQIFTRLRQVLLKDIFLYFNIYKPN